jgi:hypothetical protein
MLAVSINRRHASCCRQFAKLIPYRKEGRIRPLSRPLASICSMSSSSFGWPAETWSGSMLHLIRLRNGLHRQITEAFPWNEAPYLRLAPTLVCGRSELSVRPVENSNSGYSWPPGERRRCSPPRHRPIACMSAAMACPSGRVGEQLERHADKHRFPMRIRPGDRPPVQRSANRPLMWNCCRH